MYFVATAVLGFVLGVAALALALDLAGQQVALGGVTALILVPGAALSAVGGGIVARAYREVRRRGR